ncbi:hypothetical protein [Aquimarina sp. 2201CG14-23]|uniref:hypothetical protein n=1 Tax=Aquimarina mycalae TaxID=3040073 RepID=UPI002477F1DA|nr:hypothetical protein [Aquimarina sp. 2201CG14-23]MDH7447636.1 hypothetical protein [Aquimarina sp. 2201CG14-23]
MALDFHKFDNNEHLFGLDDKQYAHLENLFVEFKQKTGVYIDPYRDIRLSVDHQKTMLKIIDAWIYVADLNKNKLKTETVIQFKTWMDYFSNKDIDIQIVGD